MTSLSTCWSVGMNEPAIRVPIRGPGAEVTKNRNNLSSEPLIPNICPIQAVNRKNRGQMKNPNTTQNPANKPMFSVLIAGIHMANIKAPESKMQTVNTLIRPNLSATIAGIIRPGAPMKLNIIVMNGVIRFFGPMVVAKRSR
ncbi:hypothetical protein WICPIJ_006813 [Wickerhamomyces pijperi]|uniref:Uncharacterized protein n=1 Tax=Wickerhamomyces pijperi TaxID=599730 RepID=A0A9P8Q1P0_WICPI|nr:hypothetical protein WICPIJ_006813 [Wickerhamomyces pijperi]